METSLPESLEGRLPADLVWSKVAAHVPLGPDVLLVVIDGGLRTLCRAAGAARFAWTEGERPALEDGAVLLKLAGEAERRIPLDWLELDLVASFLREAPPDRAGLLRVAAQRSLLATLSDSPLLLFTLLIDLARLRATTPAPSPAMPLDIPRIERELSTATTVEILQLVALLRQQWKISEEAVATAETGGAFTVAILEPGGNKLAVIKAIHELREVGLAEAKALASSQGVIAERLGASEAAALKTALEAAGAVVSVVRTP